MVYKIVFSDGREKIIDDNLGKWILEHKAKGVFQIEKIFDENGEDLTKNNPYLLLSLR